MIIAVDFDGILCENAFPEIGKPNYEVISLIRQLMDKGHEVVLWTTRNGQELNDAVLWCKNRGLHFCAINDQAPSNKEKFGDMYPTESRKVYADVYVDDHSVEFLTPLSGIKPMDLIINGLTKGVRIWQTEEN